jgi:hypothetical protein
MSRLQSKESILKAEREKCQLMYKLKNIRIISHLSAEKLKPIKAQNDIFHATRLNNCQTRILYPEKLAIKVSGQKDLPRNAQTETIHDD